MSDLSPETDKSDVHAVGHETQNGSRYQAFSMRNSPTAAVRPEEQPMAALK